MFTQGGSSTSAAWTTQRTLRLQRVWWIFWETNVPDSEGGLMNFASLQVDLQFVKPSCSCWSLLCWNNEMQPWFPFFWVKAQKRVTFSAPRAAGVTGSQRIRLSVSWGKSLVCCGCCFDFLVMCIFIHDCKNKHGLPDCHTDPFLSLVNSVKPMLHSRPGVTHFLQLWSSGSVAMAPAEWAWFRSISCITTSGLFFLGLHFLSFSSGLGVLYLAGSLKHSWKTEIRIHTKAFPLNFCLHSRTPCNLTASLLLLIPAEYSCVRLQQCILHF